MYIIKNNSPLNHIVYNLKESKNLILYMNLTDREDIYHLSKHYKNKKYAIKLNSLKEFYYIINNYSAYLKNKIQLHIVCFSNTASDYIPWDMKVKSEENNLKTYYNANSVKDGIIDYALFKNVPVTVQTNTTCYRVGWIAESGKYRRTESRTEWEELNEFYTQQAIENIQYIDDSVQIPENMNLYAKIEDLLTFGKDFNIDISINLSNTDGVDSLYTTTNHFTQKQKQLFEMKYLTKHLTAVDITRITDAHASLMFFMDMWRNKEDLSPFFDSESTIICPKCGYPIHIVKDSKKGYCSAFGDFPGNCTITYQADEEDTQCNGCGHKPLL